VFEIKRDQAIDIANVGTASDETGTDDVRIVTEQFDVKHGAPTVASQGMTLGATTTAALEVNELTVRFGNKVAVDNVTFTVSPGEVVALLGPNGAGKTTTLRALEGYCAPTSGTAKVSGLDPLRDHGEVVKLLGVMPQGGGIYPALRVKETLNLFASYYEHPRSTEELAELLGLTHLERTAWRRLSGGEQQRLSLALALVGNPSIVIVDEPTAGVDPEGRLVIREVIATLRAQGVAILMTSHELSEVAVSADRLVFLSHGRVLASGTKESLAEDSTTRATFTASSGLDCAQLSQALGAEITELRPGNYQLGEGFEPGNVASLATALSAVGATLDNFSAGGGLEDLYYDLYRTEPAHEAPAQTTPRRSRRGAK